MNNGALVVNLVSRGWVLFRLVSICRYFGILSFVLVVGVIGG